MASCLLLSLRGPMAVEHSKRVGIAAEVAANASILFLDDPTAGMDSREAWHIFKCIRVSIEDASLLAVILLLVIDAGFVFQQRQLLGTASNHFSYSMEVEMFWDSQVRKLEHFG